MANDNNQQRSYSEDQFMGASSSDLSTPAPEQDPVGPRSYNESSFMGTADNSPLSNKPDDSNSSIAGKFAGTAAIKNLSHIPGFFGDAADLGRLLGSGAQSLVTSTPYKEVEANKKSLYENHPINWDTIVNKKQYGNLVKLADPSTWIPSGETVQNLLFNKDGGAGLGEYKPESGLGRVGMAGLEAATPGFSGKTATAEKIAGAVPRAVDVAKNYLLKSFIPQGAAGVAGSVAGEATGNPFLSLGASLVAGHGANTASRSIEASRSPDRMSKLIAGKILRDSATDHNSALNSLDPSSLNLFPNINPTTANLSKDSGLLALNNVLFEEGKNNRETATDRGRAHSSATNKDEANLDAYNSGVNGALVDFDPKLKDQYGLNGDSDSHQVSSRNARDIYSNLEEEADQKVKDAWNEVPNANVYAKKVIASIKEKINSLTAVHQKLLDGTALGALNNLEEKGANQFSLKELQDIRSQFLAAARKEPGTPLQIANNDMAAHIKDLMSEESNVAFGDRNGSIGAWKNAVETTKQYHDVFNRGFLESLNSDKNGVPKVSMDATLEATLSGRNRAQNVQQLRDATGNAVDPHIVDYLIGKLTHNGQRELTPEQIDAEISRNGSIYESIPGAMDRIQGIKNAALKNVFFKDLLSQTKNGANPNGILKVINDHRDIVEEMSRNDPTFADTLEKLEHSSKYFSNPNPSEATNTSSIGKLQKGNAGDFLYTPKQQAALTASLTGGLGYSMLHGVDPTALLTGGALLGFGGGHLPNIKDLQGKIISGQVPEKVLTALHEARGNPEKAKMLMSAPDLEKMKSLSGSLVGATAGQRGAQYVMNRPTPYTPSISEMGKNDQPKSTNEGDTFSKMLEQESGNQQFDKEGNPIVNKTSDAIGAAQIKLGTGPEAAKYAGEPWDEDRLKNDADYNRKLGKAYYEHMLDVFKDPVKAVAAYNFGPDNLRKLIEKHGEDFVQHLPEETRNYLRSVLGYGRSSGGRINRASGGRLDGIEPLVQRLMSKYMQAKKATDKTTEPLLNEPDEHIVHALKVAQDAI